MRRRLRKSGAKFESGVYVCKWYKTAGVKTDSIGGPKYIHREYFTLSNLVHENIVRYVDFAYETKGARLARLYLEYCEGGDLSHYEQPGGKRLSTMESAQVFHQVSQALLYLHHGVCKHGTKLELARSTLVELEQWQAILHRDIKPANSDFGIAKFEVNGTDTYVGSREYLAPEQHRVTSARRTTIKSDIWALGETLKRLCPFDIAGSTDEGSITDQRSLVECMTRLLSKCLDVDDESRPNSASIVEEMDRHVETLLGQGMLCRVVDGILYWDTNTASKSHRQKLRNEVHLCRRLLDAGLKPGQPTIHTAMSSIEGIALEAARPVWKTNYLQRLVALFQEYAPGEVQEYEESRRAAKLAQEIEAHAKQDSPKLQKYSDADDAFKQFANQERLRVQAAQEVEAQANRDSPKTQKYSDTDDAFKQFANQERVRIQAAQEQNRMNSRQEKNDNLNSLKAFGANFKLQSRVPDDLKPMLARDREEQLAIKASAERQAYEENQRLRNAQSPEDKPEHEERKASANMVAERGNKPIAGKRRMAPMKLGLDTTRPVDDVYPSWGLMSVRAARFLDPTFERPRYPSSVMPGSPTNLDTHIYDKTFLLKFQPVCTWEPMINWKERIAYISEPGDIIDSSASSPTSATLSDGNEHRMRDTDETTSRKLDLLQPRQGSARDVQMPETGPSSMRGKPMLQDPRLSSSKALDDAFGDPSSTVIVREKIRR
ncbi:G2-specific protein kinase nimA [Pseudocercospora fuligena]|uniref:non-specific serine/threonine protein kinase n=1 Tax=Pseudocercospora fuligena TaxID=685502 RepID=A0A8H6RCY6_9PEZI|nr:G2-specific protein kinase nimA [Pseudocercospora fuligena]